jgi:FKBP-type peptidyl-prolyl cis-trans isomerase
MIVGLISCNLGKNLEDYEEEEKLNIQKFLSDHDTLTFEIKASGLYYLDILEGTGPQAETHDTAYIFYVWQFLSGQIYDTNIGTTDTLIFPVNEGKLLAVGFDETVTYMKEGGRAVSLVPSSLAFGSSGQYFTLIHLSFSRPTW